MKRVEIKIFRKDGSFLEINSYADISVNTKSLSISQLGEGEVTISPWKEEESPKLIYSYNTGELIYNPEESMVLVKHNLNIVPSNLEVKVEFNQEGTWVNPLEFVEPAFTYEPVYESSKEEPHLSHTAVVSKDKILVTVQPTYMMYDWDGVSMRLTEFNTQKYRIMVSVKQ